MVLLDWTRMGRAYCLAGAVPQEGEYRIVRPLLTRGRDRTDPRAGWSAYLLDGHTRWEVFQLVGPLAAPAEPPHVEDLWVRSLEPRRQVAPPALRRQILTATLPRPHEPLFGQQLEGTLGTAYLRPGTGQRSLVTVVVHAAGIQFTASSRGGAEPDIRVRLPLEELANRQLPVKDHHLLCRAEQASPTLPGRLKMLDLAIRQMGERVAVRLGLSRPYSPRSDGSAGFCWLMADGFFSFSNPQP
jgi:hypothetical protein